MRDQQGHHGQQNVHIGDPCGQYDHHGNQNLPEAQHGPQSSQTSTADLLRDLRAMFSDGRRLLELGQQVQVRQTDSSF